jgi:sec-independent protein translocase protein TatB
MFDIGASEFLLVVIVAIVVIGPKDLPLALRTAGKWIGKIRRVSGHFRAGIETMIREAELEEMERTWREQNATILAGLPPAQATADPALPPAPGPDDGAVGADGASGGTQAMTTYPQPVPLAEPEQRPLPLQPPA